MAPAPPVRHRGHGGHLRRDEHPPSLLIPLEAVRYCLSQRRCPGSLIAVFPPAFSKLQVGLQRRQHLAVAVGELDAFDDHVFAMLPGQAIRHPQPQGQGAVAGNPRHAQLAAAGLIPAPQDEELAAAGSPPTGQPLLMAAVAVGLQVVLAAPELPAAEAQPDQAHRRVGLDPAPAWTAGCAACASSDGPRARITLLPRACQLPAGPADQALQGLDMQKLGLPAPPRPSPPGIPAPR